MTDSTSPTDAPPEQDAAGVPRRYGTAARAPPVRLRLEVDEPLLRLIRSMRSLLSGAPRAEEEGQPPEPPKKKGLRKLRKVALRLLQAGPRKIPRTDKVDVVAKFQYNKPQKIVCQLRRGDNLARIEILWSKIKAMYACFDDARFDTLRIEVKSPSEQYRAGRPTGRMHLQWERSEDIAASTFCLVCDKGTLEIAYGKMLYTDPSLIPLTLPPPPPPPPPPAASEEDEGSQASPGTQESGTYTAAAPAPHLLMMLKQRCQAPGC
ncbi:unnamed protein product [Alopecurus aequalis]